MFCGNQGSIHNMRSFGNTESSINTAQPKAGSSAFNGTTGQTISHNIGIDTTYQVSITPTATLAGRWYVKKKATSFTVYSTEAADAGAFDWAIVQDAT